MKLTENSKIATPKSKLEKFSEREFTLKLNGFELLALWVVSRNIGGIGKFRNVFSSTDPTYEGFGESISGMDGSMEARIELENKIKIDPKENVIRVIDKP